MKNVVKLEILETQSGEHFIARDLEYGLLAWAKTQKKLKKRLQENVVGHMHFFIERGKAPFSEPHPVPREEDVHEGFRSAEDRHEFDFTLQLNKPVKSDKYTFKVDWRRG